jgi:dihydrofolate reductase
MEKIIIVAKADNNVIGKNNTLLWHLPADLEAFRKRLKDCSYLITGRKSFESVAGQEIFSGNEQVIVITKQKSYQGNRAKVAHSIEEALKFAQEEGAKKVCILGGGKIYQQTMELADQLIVTEVHAEFEGDTFFPEIDKSQWQEISRRDYHKDLNNPYDYSFVVYQKK